jgi:hypothetical protein
MSRTKWMRLTVRDLADVLRWAGEQQARHIGDFRYRLINGRESVSFRLITNYGIEVGTRDIVVVCHVRGGALSRVGLGAHAAITNIAANAASFVARLRALSGPIAEPVGPSAEVHPFPLARRLG